MDRPLGSVAGDEHAAFRFRHHRHAQVSSVGNAPCGALGYEASRTPVADCDGRSGSRSAIIADVN